MSTRTYTVISGNLIHLGTIKRPGDTLELSEDAARAHVAAGRIAEGAESSSAPPKEAAPVGNGMPVATVTMDGRTLSKSADVDEVVRKISDRAERKR